MNAYNIAFSAFIFEADVRLEASAKVMIVVEYYIKGEAEKHARYFSTHLAARNFCVLLKSDPACAGIRVIS